MGPRLDEESLDCIKKAPQLDYKSQHRNVCLKQKLNMSALYFNTIREKRKADTDVCISGNSLPKNSQVPTFLM